VALLSLPESIEDRTRYLMGKTNTNPAYAIVDVIEKLDNLGVSVCGIPCNTMHAPEIFDEILRNMEKRGLQVRLLNMIEEVMKYIDAYPSRINRVGILSTTGTWKSGVYPNALRAYGYEPIVPRWPLEEEIHEAIYDPQYGIKAQSNPVTNQARNILIKGLRDLKDKGAEGIVLGCSEISFAMPYRVLEELPLFNATLILARALIAHTYPEKLKSF
ncbi:MAG: amino acid racemase, partial [Bacteroidales bacterium]|nr:amino acid racemase [Bacteroidales bacterium]